MPTIELRLDTGGIPPHAFLVVTGPDGVPRGYGFAPANHHEPAGPGHLYDDTNHSYTSTTGPIEIDQAGYDYLMSYIQETTENPPPYDVYFGSQCTNWAMRGLYKSGVDLFNTSNMHPDSLVHDFLETLFRNPYTLSINLAVRNFFSSAFNWMVRRDPLTLDLDGDGIESTGINQSNPVLFDHDGDGIRTGTGWISPDDGFLVLDRNGNGTIDSGRELFGDSTLLPNGSAAQDGFAALAAEDTNSDGQVSASDAHFDQLRVWRDLNQDGISQGGELFTLASLGITAINVASVERNQTLGNGNRIADVGTYVRADGTAGTVGETHGTADVDLADDPFYREFPDHVPPAEGVTDLPNMGGSGLVRDLWEAASLSTELRDVVDQFAQADTRSEQLALIDELLLEWAQTAGMDSMEERALDHQYGLRWQQIGSAVNTWSGFLHAAPSGGGSVGNSGGNGGSLADPEAIAARAAWEATLGRTRDLFTVLEAFNGRYFFALPVDPFVGAASGRSVFSMSDPDDPPSGGGGSVVTYPVLQLAVSQAQLDALNESYQVLREGVYNALAFQTRLEPLIDMIEVTSNSAGTDILLNFTAVETELQSRVQQDPVNGIADMIEFARGVSRAAWGGTWNPWAFVEQQLLNLAVTPELQSLYDELGIQIAATGVQVLHGTTRADFLLGGGANETLHGNNGSDVLDGNGGDDNLQADAGDDILDGGDGVDTLVGGIGNDQLTGGAGNDFLYGEDGYGGINPSQIGNDVLDGGAGNDVLAGGFGSDTYLFGRGDGQDTLYNEGDLYGFNIDPTVDKLDVLQFKDGVLPSEVTLTRSGDNLIVKITGTTDQVTLVNYFIGDGQHAEGYAVNQIRFADGTVWDVATVKAAVVVPTTANDVLIGYASDDVIDGLAGNDTLEGRGSNDTLTGGLGDDTLRGEDGNDTLTGGDGNDIQDGGNGTDVLQGGDGADTLAGGIGDDQLTGGAGNDFLYGEDGYGGINLSRLGNDVLDGGAGNDVLAGGFGSDTYLFGRDDGQDTLNNEGDLYGANLDPTANKLDVLQFKDGVLPSEVTLTRSGDNLIVKITGTSDQVTVVGYFTSDGLHPEGLAVDQIRFADGTIWDVATVKAAALQPTSGNDVLTGYATNDTINGADGNDTLSGAAGNDTLDGGAGADIVRGDDGADSLQGGDGADTLEGGIGDDTLTGGAGNDFVYGEDGYGGINLSRIGNDVLDGGAGNDVLAGGFGSDTYLFGRGDGQDTLNNEGDLYGFNIDPTANKLDVLQFKDGVLPSEVTLTRSGDNLIVKITGTTDQVTVVGYFTSDGLHAEGLALDQIRFADGTIWDVATVKAAALQPTSGNDVLTGYATNDTINGADGNDTLSGAAGNDTLDGGAGADIVRGDDGADSLQGGDGADTLEGGIGDDTVIGGAGNDFLYGEDGYGGINLSRLGNDVLDGSAGNDVLAGGFGSDTYLFGRGDGQDTLYNEGDLYGFNIDPTANKLDVLQFKDGVLPSEVMLTRSGTDLIVKISGTTDQVTVVGYFIADGLHPEGYAVNQMRFADGTVWDIAYVTQRVRQGTEGPDTLTAPATGATLYGLAGADTLNGGAGADVLDGGAGNDGLYGNNGNDVLDGGDGADTLAGGIGNDQLTGGAGNDSLYGEDGYGGINPSQIGNDVLDGGAGNDVLAGGFGSDTYLFGRGDGQDTLYNEGDLYGFNIDPTANKLDVLQFKEGVLPSEVTLTRSGDNLIVKITGTTDQVTLVSYFIGDGLHAEGYAVNQIRFADGTIWDVAAVKAAVLQPTSGNDVLTGYASNDTINGADGNDTLEGRAGNDTLTGGLGADTLRGEDGADILDGGDGADTLEGGIGDDTVTGGAGNDYVYGEDGYGGINLSRIGNDVLDGGAGNDVLAGGFGSDTYLFGRGDGQDTLYNEGDLYGFNIDPTANKLDVLQFKEGVLPSEVTLTRSGDNLIVKIIGTTDQVTVAGYFIGDGLHAEGYAVNQIRFADGTIWDVPTVKAAVLQPTSGNDVLTGYASNDTINGADGNDTLEGRAGNDTLTGGLGVDTLRGEDGADILDGGDGADTLEGGIGDDTLTGGAGNDFVYGEDGYGGINLSRIGNDVLDGGAGNDVLAGGFGSDTYLFGRGDGQDTLYNEGDLYGFNIDPTANKLDVLQFKEGVLPSEVTLTRSGDNLIVKITGTTDQVTVVGYFIGDGLHAEGYAVNQIRFADGTAWDVATVKDLVLVGSANADTLTGYASNDLLRAYQGNDSLAGQGGNDILQAGAGADTLTDTAGNNAFDGGADADSMTGGSGKEIFLGGTGNDSIVTGAGADVIGFNRGDGADTVAASTGADNTLSLGGNLSYADLSFRKSGNNLILDVGAGDQITFQDWYSSPSNRSVLDLQVIAESMAGFAPGGSDPLLDSKVEQFDFLGLVDRFDQARTANPSLTSWALTNALLEFHDGNSDSAAIGGDLAYQYGRFGNLTDIGVVPAHANLSNASFGSGSQGLTADSELRTGVVRLA